jgi:hypothetical protein
MDTLPQCLQYGASQSQARIARQTVRPLGADNGSAGQTVRFKLPSKSIVDLRSLSLYYQYTIDGIVADANNWSNVQIPNSQKHWRSVRWYVSGVLASGGACNHYDQVAHALVAATGSEDWAYSRMNNGYDEILDSSILTGQPGAVAGAAGFGDGYVAAAGQLPAARSLLMTFDDLLGLPNTKNYCIDTSLFGDVELELQFNDNTMFKATRAGAVTQANAVTALSAKFSNIRLCVNTVVSISPLYVSLLSARISGSDQAIRIPFQNLISQFAANTGSNRITCNAGSIDSLLVIPFTADPNTHGVYAAVANLSANPPRYKYAVNDVAANFSISVGSEQFPRQPVQNFRDCADITTNSIFGNSTKSTNLLYHGQAVGAGTSTYTRSNYLSERAVCLIGFGLESESWASGKLTGLDTAQTAVDIVVNTSGAALATHLLIVAMCTSCLVFDPKTSAVSVEM